MTNADKIRSMTDEQLATFFCAVSADLWGICKAAPDPFDMEVNMEWLSREAGDCAG